MTTSPTLIVMKCFERIVMSHIKTNTTDTMDPFQFAYRLNRSTEDAISTTIHILPLLIWKTKTVMFECCLLNIVQHSKQWYHRSSSKSLIHLVCHTTCVTASELCNEQTPECQNWELHIQDNNHKHRNSTGLCAEPFSLHTVCDVWPPRTTPASLNSLMTQQWLDW